LAALKNLGMLYSDQRRLEEAEVLFLRALALEQKAFGVDPDGARIMNNLAGVYQRRRQYAGAEEMYRRVLAIQEKKLGAEDVEVGRTLNNLARAYSSERRYAEAESLYLRAIAIQEKSPGRVRTWWRRCSTMQTWSVIRIYNRCKPTTGRA
jgi:tetratricopeptide (TPR) repeat protein